MARSLRVAAKYIQKVKSALQRNSYPSQKALADDIVICLSTVKNFLSGKPVDYVNFVEIRTYALTRKTKYGVWISGI